MFSVGQRLKEERERLEISLDDISGYTKISPRYLVAIEQDRFHQLPSYAHAKAYIGKYADLLQLPKEDLLDTFREEYFKGNVVFGTAPVYTSVFKRLSRSTISITTNQIIILGVMLLTFLFLFYIYTQITSLLAAPRLLVKSPEQGQIVEEEPFILVNGETDTDATVYINQQRIDLEIDTANNRAIFREKIELSTQYNQKILITAENTVSGAKTEEVRTITNKYFSALSNERSTTTEKLRLHISTTKSTSFTITIDDGEPVTENLDSTTEQTYIADTSITITAPSPHLLKYQLEGIQTEPQLINSLKKKTTLTCTAEGCKRS